MPLQTVIDEARSWIGTEESPPGSNVVPGITDWLEYDGPRNEYGGYEWCVAAVSLWLSEGGEDDLYGVQYSNGAAGTDTVAKYFIDLGRFDMTPQAGDLVLYDRTTEDPYTDHLALVTHVNEDGTFNTIDGNDGNQVRENLDIPVNETVVGFAHLEYEPGDGDPVPPDPVVPESPLLAWVAFNPDFYLEKNPDVREAGVDPLAHYQGNGWREGRDPSPAFDTSFYLEKNPDVAAADRDPLDHFQVSGANENRAPNPYFDPAFYLEANPDVAQAGVDPFEHYQGNGWREGRDPSPAFDTSFYLDRNLDVVEADLNPLDHFLNHGLEEGRLPKDQPYQDFLVPRETVDYSEALPDTGKRWDFAYADHNDDDVLDLVGIERRGASGHTEVHIWDGATKFQSLFQYETALERTGKRWDFAYEDHNDDYVPDLVAINRRGADGHTEVSVLNGADGFQSFLLEPQETALERTGKGWQFAYEDHNDDGVLDLIGVNRRGADGHTEVSVLNGADKFETFLLEPQETALERTGSGWQFAYEDHNDDGVLDLVGVKRRGDSGHTEVHVLDGANEFKSFLVQAETALPRTGKSWDFAYEDHNDDGVLDLVGIENRKADGHIEVRVLDGQWDEPEPGPLPGPGPDPEPEPEPGPDDPLAELNSTGASDETASQDGLPEGGVEASHTMAGTDAADVFEFAPRFEAAGDAFGVSPALLAAIASRESRGGKALDPETGTGDGGNGHGIMQVDDQDKTREIADIGPDFGSQEHIDQATGILFDFLEEARTGYPDWGGAIQLQAATAAYNRGSKAFDSGPGAFDESTTGGDYSNDVIARAQYYAENWDTLIA